ncbi:hypothetical protein [Zavarzinella formosa]|uniref:hypothetical protein n=1 Tax=Zavarzinella formosa TaxID=360055 RepID=UPI0002D9619D|nr:hypothetical protein [Zavarzinella formosa]
MVKAHPEYWTLNGGRSWHEIGGDDTVKIRFLPLDITDHRQRTVCVIGQAVYAVQSFGSIDGVEDVIGTATVTLDLIGIGEHHIPGGAWQTVGDWQTEGF